MNIDLIKKYCNNTCTVEELNSVLKWFEEFKGTPAEKDLLLRIWEETPDYVEIDEPDFESILDKVHHRLNPSLITDFNRENIRKNRSFRHYFIRVAAILLIPVLAYGLYMTFKYQSVKKAQSSGLQTYNEVFSSVDAITKVTLPDGSNVWLNHSSSLRYPSFFQANSRIVELKGEGYFEVAHNPDVPFIVKAGDILITATGTVFNILAYPEEDKIETSLISGMVELRMPESVSNGVTHMKMKPTDLAIFQKTNNELIMRTVKDDRYFSWKDGKLVFNKEPMGEVVKKLRRWYNVDIQINDPSLFDLNYTATFVHETLPQVMELLAMITPISYSISNREEMKNGSFTKRQIILSHRK
jgi:transmembrane sensor